MKEETVISIAGRPHVFTGICTTGGIGISTTVATVGGVLVEVNAQVLLIDGDKRPNKYYSFASLAPVRPAEVVRRGATNKRPHRSVVLPEAM